MEQLNKSINSLHEWLLSVDERLIRPVVYQRADSDEIHKQLSQQEVILISHLVICVCFDTVYVTGYVEVKLEL